MTLGLAAVTGVTAARAAREGLLGTADHVALGPRLTSGLGRRFLFDDTGVKPNRSIPPAATNGIA